MNRPVIGVVPLWDETKGSLWMLPGYMDGIEQAGGLPVMLPLSTDKSVLEQICRLYDGFLFTGGRMCSPDYTVKKQVIAADRSAENGMIWNPCCFQESLLIWISRLLVSAGGSSFSTSCWEERYLRTCPPNINRRYAIGRNHPIARRLTV